MKKWIPYVLRGRTNFIIVQFLFLRQRVFSTVWSGNINFNLCYTVCSLQDRIHFIPYAWHTKNIAINRKKVVSCILAKGRLGIISVYYTQPGLRRGTRCELNSELQVTRTDCDLLAFTASIQVAVMGKPSPTPWSDIIVCFRHLISANFCHTFLLMKIISMLVLLL